MAIFDTIWCTWCFIFFRVTNAQVEMNRRIDECLNITPRVTHRTLLFHNQGYTQISSYAIIYVDALDKRRIVTPVTKFQGDGGGRGNGGMVRLVCDGHIFESHSPPPVDYNNTTQQQQQLPAKPLFASYHKSSFDHHKGWSNRERNRIHFHHVPSFLIALLEDDDYNHDAGPALNPSHTPKYGASGVGFALLLEDAVRLDEGGEWSVRSSLPNADAFRDCTLSFLQPLSNEKERGEEELLELHDEDRSNSSSSSSSSSRNIDILWCYAVRGRGGIRR
mmetsp:Transcript_27934/g.47315  ORF Transcript_27934/g.47315 Transcript_27934/m.47315 type:complete len:277 (-) Transcript_27934:220-1050(-)